MLWKNNIVSHPFDAVILDALVILGVSVGSIAMRLFIGMNFYKERLFAVFVSYAGMVSIIGCSLAVKPMNLWDELVYFLSFLLGIFYSWPFIYWIDEFSKLFGQMGRAKTLGVYVGTTIVMGLVSAGLFAHEMRKVTLLLVSVVLLGLSFAGFVVWAKHNGCSKGEGAERGTLPGYKPSPYAISILGCFGLAWGLASCYSCVCDRQSSFDVSTVLVPLVGLSVALYFWNSKTADRVHYGDIVRLMVMLVGISWAAVPLLEIVADVLICPLLALGTFVVGVVMALFSIEIGYERGSALDVTASNLAVFCLFSTLGVLGMGMLVIADDKELVMCVASFAAVVAAMCAVPLLPKRASSAGAFTQKRLSENDSFDERLVRNSAQVATRCGLTTREREVMGLLLQGKKRAQIAEELGLSPWTVKDYVSTVYEKTGVHSARELVILVSGE